MKKVEVKDGQKFIFMEPLNQDLIIDFEIIFNNPLIRTRRKEFKLSSDDLTQIYNSRTFVYMKILTILKNGFGERWIVRKCSSSSGK